MYIYIKVTKILVYKKHSTLYTKCMAEQVNTKECLFLQNKPKMMIQDY